MPPGAIVLSTAVVASLHAHEAAASPGKRFTPAVGMQVLPLSQETGQIYRTGREQREIAKVVYLDLYRVKSENLAKFYVTPPLGSIEAHSGPQRITIFQRSLPATTKSNKKVEKNCTPQLAASENHTP